MLEKILEEIDRLHTKILNDKFACKVTEQEITALVNVKHMLRKRMNDGWIPVEKRLPEGNAVNPITRDAYVYSVTVDFGGITDVRYYSFFKGHWYNQSPKIMDDFVIAWKERPEPYCPEKGRE